MIPTPPITTLSVIDNDFDQPSQSWCKPFKKLLPLLRIIDGSNAKIKNNHRFSFQHTNDLSELSRIFLSVTISPGVTREIATDSIQFDDSDSSCGQAFIAELEEYANRVLSRVRDYCDRLIRNGIIHDTSAFQEVDLVTCPLCHSPLWSCEECDATVVCSNGDCAGSQVVDCERCAEHECMACRQCLDSKTLGLIPSFVRCWTCGSWCCRKDVSWCPGRIIHPTPTEELVINLSRASNFDSKSIVRSHSPKPGSCRSCVDSGYADEWQSCRGLYSVLCPSSIHPYSGFSIGGRGVYCAECFTQGQHCACGGVWLCDTCSVVSPLYPHLISCLRCGARYCTDEHGCEYCHFCSGCFRAGLCFGCEARDQEDVEEEDTSSESSHSLEGFERCQQCRSRICEECCSTGGEGVAQCPGCKLWMCGVCVAFGEQCPSCS
ncbi:hypothetical protein OG21DRAFT_147581 [Imleria badia]|nr:hypothetical protein OG21DRAFT_147581 [Imleria badia]